MLLIHLIRLDVSGMKDLSHSHRCYRFSVSFPQRERQNGNSFIYLPPGLKRHYEICLIRLADFKCWREAGCSASDGSSNGLFGLLHMLLHSVNCGSLGKQTARIKYCKSRCMCVGVCVIFWGPWVSEGLNTAIMERAKKSCLHWNREHLFSIVMFKHSCLNGNIHLRWPGNM